MGSGTKPVINSWEATYLIRQGLSDLSLMKRYSISAKGLESLFSKLVCAGDITQEELEKRSLRFLLTNAVDLVSTPVIQSPEKIIINAAEAVDCIRSGMSDQAIMEKYNLSTRGLDSLFRKLAAAREIDQDELDTRRNVLEWAEIAFVHISESHSLMADPPRLLLEQGRESEQSQPLQSQHLAEKSDTLGSPVPPTEGIFAGVRSYVERHRTGFAACGGVLAGIFLLAIAFSFVAGVDYALETTLLWWRTPPPTSKAEDSLHEQAERTTKVLQAIAEEAPKLQGTGKETFSRFESYQECMKNCEDEVDMGDHLDRVLLMYCRRECALRRNETAQGIRKRYHQPSIQF